MTAAGLPAGGRLLRKEESVKKVTMFYLLNCPYCKQAHRVIDDLYAENPAYKDIEIDYVEESMQPSVAEQYDYYYVPTFFIGKEKISEARTGESYEECKANIRRVFDIAMA